MILPREQLKTQEDPFQFIGFTIPRYTQIPDIVFDELAHILTGAEYKLLMYILRRTFGFKKDSDAISYSQMLDGIIKRDGTRLDHGAGIKSDRTLTKALRRLEELNIIYAKRQESKEKGLETTVYYPNMGGLPPTAKIAVPPTAKIAVPPTAKIAVTRNSLNNKQTETRNRTTNRNGEFVKNGEQTGKKEVANAPVVVVSLLKKQGIGENQIQGIIEKSNDKVAAREDSPTLENYVREKITFRDFEIENNPQNIKNKTAWLICALTNDYAKPFGFKTEAEIAAEKQKQAQKLADAERQKREYEEELEREKLEAEAKAKQVEDAKNRAIEQYEVEETQTQKWENALETAFYTLSADEQFTIGRILCSLILLSISDGKAYIFIEHANMHQTYRLKPSLQRAMIEMLDRRPDARWTQFVFLTEDDFLDHDEINAYFSDDAKF